MAAYAVPGRRSAHSREGFLGDVAIAGTAPGPSIAVRVQRYWESSFQRPRVIPTGAGAVTGLAVALDYRGDVLAAWQQNGSIFACTLFASGRTGTRQLVGPSSSHPQIQAVVSDNEHGMIAWSSTDLSRPSEPTTRTYLSLSSTAVHFTAPRVLASFPAPSESVPARVRFGLERLASENVLLAWTVAEGGRYLIRAAPAVFASRRHSRIISSDRSQAILAGLGPVRRARRSPCGVPPRSRRV